MSSHIKEESLRETWASLGKPKEKILMKLKLVLFWGDSRVRKQLGNTLG